MPADLSFEWSGMGPISRRFTTCNSQIRGVPFEPQADEYAIRILFCTMSDKDCHFGRGARP